MDFEIRLQLRVGFADPVWDKSIGFIKGIFKFMSRAFSSASSMISRDGSNSAFILCFARIQVTSEYQDVCRGTVYI